VCIYIRIYAYVYVYIYVYVCMYICIYVYIYMYIYICIFYGLSKAANENSMKYTGRYGIYINVFYILFR
jgi:hypothetical protein